MAIIHYNHCPVCHSNTINPLLTVKDHSVSREQFVIWQCSNCGLQFTQDVPDQDSIAPYYQSSDYISHSNTSKGLINKVYQRVREHTLNTKADLVMARTKARGKILDLGAGIGAFLHTMEKRNWQVTGLEPDPGARQVAKKLYHLNLEDSSELSTMNSNSFDAITLWHVLEHVHDLHDYVEELKRLLAKNGRIFIAVPNYEAPEHDVYKLYWAAYDVPRHLYHFTPAAMKNLLGQHGLQIEEIRPMWFDSFYISLLSSKYKNGRTNWLGAGFAGIKTTLATMFNKEKSSSLIYVIKA